MSAVPSGQPVARPVLPEDAMLQEGGAKRAAYSVVVGLKPTSLGLLIASHAPSPRNHHPRHRGDGVWPDGGSAARPACWFSTARCQADRPRCVSSIPSEGYSRSPTETQLEFPSREGYEPRLIRRLFAPRLNVGCPCAG